MNPWIETYDSEEVHWLLRQQVAGLSAAVSGAVAVLLLMGSLVGLDVLPDVRMFWAVALLAAGVAIGVILRLVGLRSRVWCVKLSPQMIMGYNHLRRGLVFPWSDVDHVAFSDAVLSIVAQDGIVIEIPTSFADYTHVSHRILDLAELHRRPIHLTGEPLSEIDVFRLMPELRTLFAPPQVSAF